MFQGKGKLTRADGAVYEGDFVAGMRQGHGTLLLANGDSYSGTWVGGCEHVSGTFIRPREYEYSGGVDAGAFHGVGTLNTASGHVYDGSFADGEKNGWGALDGQDGSRYACAVRTLHFPYGPPVTRANLYVSRCHDPVQVRGQLQGRRVPRPRRAAGRLQDDVEGHVRSRDAAWAGYAPAHARPRALVGRVASSQGPCESTADQSTWVHSPPGGLRARAR